MIVQTLNQTKTSNSKAQRLRLKRNTKTIKIYENFFHLRKVGNIASNINSEADTHIFVEPNKGNTKSLYYPVNFR